MNYNDTTCAEIDSILVRDSTKNRIKDPDEHCLSYGLHGHKKTSLKCLLNKKNKNAPVSTKKICYECFKNI